MIDLFKLSYLLCLQKAVVPFPLKNSLRYINCMSCKNGHTKCFVECSMNLTTATCTPYMGSRVMIDIFNLICSLRSLHAFVLLVNYLLLYLNFYQKIMSKGNRFVKTLQKCQIDDRFKMSKCLG